MGILSILPGNPRSIADIVPVDIVVNGLLASIPNLADHDQHQVIHCGTSDPRENPLRWRIVSAVVPEYWRKHPPQRAIFPQTHFHMHQSHQLFQWMWFWRYTAPSSVFSTVANFVGQPSHVKKAAQLGKVNWKARTLAEVFKPFTETEWIFTTNFLQQLHMCMSPEEQKLFHLRTRGIYWSRYLANFCYGLKKWILKEEMVQVEDDTVEHTQVSAQHFDGTLTVISLVMILVGTQYGTNIRVGSRSSCDFISRLVLGFVLGLYLESKTWLYQSRVSRASTGCNGLA